MLSAACGAGGACGAGAGAMAPVGRDVATGADGDDDDKDDVIPRDAIGRRRGVVAAGDTAGLAARRRWLKPDEYEPPGATTSRLGAYVTGMGADGVRDDDAIAVSRTGAATTRSCGRKSCERSWHE